MADTPATRIDPETGEVLDERIGMEFVDFISRHQRGALNKDATDALDELVKAVFEVGKKGSLTLTISVEPLEDLVDPTLTIEAEVKIRPPKRKAASAPYFLQTNDGQFSRQQPQEVIPGFEYLKDNKND